MCQDMPLEDLLGLPRSGTARSEAQRPAACPEAERLSICHPPQGASQSPTAQLHSTPLLLTPAHRVSLEMSCPETAQLL